MKRADPRGIQRSSAKLGAPRRELVRDPLPQFLGGAVAESHGQDPVGPDTLLDQPAETLGRGERLAGAWSGRDQERALGPGVRRRRLLFAQHRASHPCRAHSGGDPPYEQMAA